LPLPGSYLRADFGTDLAELQTAITNQEDLDNAISLATANRDNQRANLRARVMEFRDRVKLDLKGTGYERGLPDTPHPTASEQKLLKAADDTASLWTRIDAETAIGGFTPPLLMRGNYTLAAFIADLATMRTYFGDVRQAENDARLARKNRDVLLDPLRERMVQYRAVIEVEYGVGHPFVQSLPDVYDSAGSTPDAVTASGQWDEMSMQAMLTWTPSTNPNLVEYEVRMTPAATYDSNNASTIGNLTPGFEQFETMEGLANPGDVASYKVYVLLSTGNEAGSNTVTITRP